VTHAAAFFVGCLAGAGLLLWLIARSIVTPERPRVPEDGYISDLAAILEKERW
jgi:hypothetical protein